MAENGQKLIAAKCALQMNPLEREVIAIVEAARIAEIAHRKRASKNFDAISRACKRWRSRIRLLGIGSDAQATADRNDACRGFDFVEKDLISRSPRKRQRVRTQSATPAQRHARIQFAGFDQ